jgi:hypothetical protein
VVYLLGALQTNRVLAADDLRAMPAAMQQSFTQTRTVGGVEQRTTLRGVKLPALYERDGQPLEPREGRLALQSTADFRLGARHVRNVLRIEVSLIH